MKRTFLLLLAIAGMAARSLAVTHTITVANFSFSPASITNVQIGDTVKWVWSNGSHTTTSTTIPAGATAWNSPMTSTTTSFIYVPTIAGTYNYQCTPHAPSMAGSFTVTGGTTGGGGTGTATTYTINVANFSFTPSTIPTVHIGDTVRWTWLNGTHTTTSVSIPTGASAWNSPITSTATTFSYVPTVAGTYSYQCQPHAPNMAGSFTVVTTGGGGGGGGLPPGLLRNIKVDDHEFKPSSLAVNVGDTIRWYYDDGNHTTTSTTIPTGAPSWNAVIDASHTSFRYVVPLPGVYNYYCTVHGTSMSGSFTASGTATGIYGVGANGLFSFYPNPAHTALYLDLTSAIGVVELNIYDMRGRRVMNKTTEGGNNRTIQVSDLPDGQYVLQMLHSGMSVTRPFTVAH